jgi:hypothetical protein
MPFSEKMIMWELSADWNEKVQACDARPNGWPGGQECLIASQMPVTKNNNFKSLSYNLRQALQLKQRVFNS